WNLLFDTVSVPAGAFMMGNEHGKAEEKPTHRVTIDRFRMSRSEITNKQYLAFLEETGYARPRDPAFAKNYLISYPKLPVINVSYADALEFCKWATAKFGVPVRLPSEAEWEYAAIGGKSEWLYPWGSDGPHNRARYKDNAPAGVPTVERDAFAPNLYGL